MPYPYPRQLHEEARLRWLKGEGIEAIAKDKKMPKAITMYKWKAKEGWDAELEVIYERAREHQRELLGQEIAKMNEEHISLSRAFLAHVSMYLGQKDETGDPAKLGSVDLDRLSRTLERSTKIERVARELPTERHASEIKGDIDISIRRHELEEKLKEEIEQFLGDR